MDNFITITPRDGSKEPLLAPNQNIYLRENIRAKLLIAAQAAPRHQNKIYKDALDHVGEWAKSYFDTANPDTKAFLDNVNSLAKRPLSIDVPEQLSSQPILADLVRKRIYNLPHSAPSQKKSEDNPQNKPEISSQPTTIEESGQAKIAVEES